MSDKVIVQLGRIIDELGKPQNIAEAGEFVRSAAVMNCPADSGHLRSNIYCETYEDGDAHVAEIYTRVAYAHFVELGTGKRGAEHHEGISPEVSPSYTLMPWWIHESQLDIGVGEKYGWFHIDTPEGRFYRCEGQPAQPFLYPALKNNEQTVVDILRHGYEEAIRRAAR